MAVLKASEKLKILALGKATLKEINELEQEALTEGDTTDEKKTEELKATDTKTEHDEENGSSKSKEDDAPVSSSVDEKDKEIEQLKAQIEQMQKDNINADNSSDTPSGEAALLDIFKDFR